jgi:hypothetical protein
MSSKRVSDSEESGDSKRVCIVLEFDAVTASSTSRTPLPIVMNLISGVVCGLAKHDPDLPSMRLQSLNTIKTLLAQFGKLNEYSTWFSDILNMAGRRHDSELIALLLRHGVEWYLDRTTCKTFNKKDSSSCRNFICELAPVLQELRQYRILDLFLWLACDAVSEMHLGWEPTIRYLLRVGASFIFSGEFKERVINNLVSDMRLSECAVYSTGDFDAANNCRVIASAQHRSELRIAECQDSLCCCYQELHTSRYITYEIAAPLVSYHRLVAWHLATQFPYEHSSDDVKLTANTWRFLMFYAVAMVSGPEVHARTYFGLLPCSVRRLLLPRFIFGLCTGEDLPMKVALDTINAVSNNRFTLQSMLDFHFTLVSDGGVPDERLAGFLASAK